MVEMALVLSIFLMLVFSILEVALAVFYASRLSEATRSGVRHATVTNASMSEISDPNITCDTLDAVGFKQCNAETCDGVVEAMNKLVAVDPSSVYIRYQCMSTGYTGKAGYSDASKEIYSITVAIASGVDADGKLIGVEYPLVFPKEILHLNYATIRMPPFESTRLSEDLWSKVD